MMGVRRRPGFVLTPGFIVAAAWVQALMMRRRRHSSVWRFRADCSATYLDGDDSPSFFGVLHAIPGRREEAVFFAQQGPAAHGRWSLPFGPTATTVVCCCHETIRRASLWSRIMPGRSPLFPDAEDIEILRRMLVAFIRRLRG